MGFISRMSSFTGKKKPTAVGAGGGDGTGSVVSEVTAASGVADNADANSDISDDYVAPNAEDLEGGAPIGTAAADEGAPAATTAATAAATATSTDAAATAGGEGEGAAAAPFAEAIEVERTPSLEAVASDLSKQVVDTADALTRELVQSASALSKQLSSEKNIELESIEDGYVNANVTTGEGLEDGSTHEIDEQMADVFNGVKGTVQPPKYKDIKFAILYAIHFAVTIWWFVESFLPQYNQYNGAYYSNGNHAGLVASIATTGIVGLGLAFVTFGYMLRHGETVVKTTIVFSVSMCLAVGVLGLLLGEFEVCACGLAGFTILSMYANMVWPRVAFTAVNLNVAITGIRQNMGLFLAALSVAGVGFVWLIITITAAVSGQKAFGGWAMVYIIFSYYWTRQVLTNVMYVTTAGVIGRWFVLGDQTPNFTTGLKEMLIRAWTHSFGCICFGSLFFGIHHTIQGLSSFLSSKGVPFLPGALNWVLEKISYVIDVVNEWAYVYVGVYGYSYTASGRNIDTLFLNKGIDGIVKEKLAGNIMFMANMAIGLLTGFCGLVFGVFEYGIMWQSGLANPTTDGFFIGFFVGFMFSSIMMSIVNATINTLIVCLAESPAAFKVHHPDESAKLERVWKEKTKSWLFF